MSADHLDHLLSAWQEQRRHGRDVPAAELCRDQPELAPELERRIAALRQLDDLAGQAAETRPPAAPPSEAAPYRPSAPRPRLVMPAPRAVPPRLRPPEGRRAPAGSACPGTRSWPRWGGAAWASSTEPGRPSWAGWWR